SASSLPYPSLSVVERALVTTAKDSFNGHVKGFQAAAQWDEERLEASHGNTRAPHLVCAEYSRGREAISHLQLYLSSDAVRPVSHSSAHGACFFVTASHAEARAISDNPQVDQLSIAPFPSALKVAPGVLEHGVSRDQASQSTTGELATTHGESMRMSNVEGLNVQLSPGTLPANTRKADSFIAQLLDDLMSESMDLHATNVWSDPRVANGDHLATPEGALRQREWSMAAKLVHKLSVSGRTTPGDICSWDSISVHHAASDLLLVSGLDHLLHQEGGEAGDREEAIELRVACFMGLVSFLSSRMEVLRVAPWHSKRLYNAAARAMIQSATLKETPLSDAGLDGTGEIIQVVDSGLDETSCFFADGDGQQVAHGHYYEELALIEPSSSEDPASSEPVLSSPLVFEGGDFPFSPDRRKIIQYINIVKSDSAPQTHGSSFSTSAGGQFPWYPADGFEVDEVAGHGTHTAGSAAGATLNSPAETVTCNGTKVVGCVGGCIDPEGSRWSDDFVTYYLQPLYADDIDRICPMFDCDDEDEQRCLDDDVGKTLTEHGGMARGAKLAIFDTFAGDLTLVDFPGNGLWEPCLGAGCKLHSNSWGGDLNCTVDPLDVEYDDFMYKNPENLLIFAAGNSGDVTDGRTVCTIASPAIGKNALAVGATSSGETRLSRTGEDGKAADGTNGWGDVDTVAYFSSYGPTQDGRIKPEVVAPGDAIYSAAGDGSDTHSCRLWAYAGTSMACPIVAGASAMVRQYFLDASFYFDDVTERGWCDDDACMRGSFSPSSATIKALLINSANLMGGSSEPDGHRGFGRIHLEMGMPLEGDGDLALFVADSANTSIPELTQHEFSFEVDAGAGLDFRATLSWIDPPATALATVQLVNNLDLVIFSPSGTTHTMWASGVADNVNVNERVIVAAEDVESGNWTVRVSAGRLTTYFQRYSLVVNGAIVPLAGDGADGGISQTS
ncbi:unnamed protein product, partial [Laminaria digitata]